MAALTFDDIFEDKKSGPLTFDDVGAGRDMGAGRAALQGFNATIPFGNRIAAGLGALGAAAVTGESVSDLYNEARQNQAATAAASPSAEMYGSLAGIAATLPVGLSKAVAKTPVLGAAANALSKASTATGNFIRGSQVAADAGRLARLGAVGLQGAKAGAVAAPIGALYGYGAAPEGERLEAAASSAGMAGGISAALPIVGSIASKITAPVINSFANKATKSIAQASGEIPKESLSPALQKVFDRLRSDFPDDVEFKKALYSYASTKDKSLIEAAGKRTENLAEGSAQYPTGGAKAVEFFDNATGAAPDKLKSSLGKTVSPDTNYYDTLDDMVKAGREKAAPVYSAAFKMNQSVQSPVISKILETPEGKSALGEAVKNMQNEMARVAKPDPELTAMVRELADIGMMDKQPGGVARGLKLRTLDYVKKSMDDTINKALRSGDEAEARRIISLKNSLVGEIDSLDKSGLYAKARATSGDYLSNKNAMDAGLNFLRDDPEIVARTFNKLGKAEKDSYRSGVVKALRNNIENRTDGQNVATIFGKESTRKRLESILSPKDYIKLMNDARATDNIYKLRNQITGNSRTAQRQISIQEFDSAGQEVITDIANNGFKMTAGKVVVNTIKKTFDGLNDKLAGEVADILYETDPQKKYQIVKGLVNEIQSTSGLRQTQAANKLRAFYGMSDAISKSKLSSNPVAGVAAYNALKE